MTDQDKKDEQGFDEHDTDVDTENKTAGHTAFHDESGDRESVRTGKEGEFGEKYGDDLGYGEEGSEIAPFGHLVSDGEGYVNEYRPPEYSELAEPAGKANPDEMTGRSRSDEEIRKEVLQRLGESRELHGYVLQAYVEDGLVTLTGQVLNAQLKEQAGAIAATAAGVEKVDNQIAVNA